MLNTTRRLPFLLSLLLFIASFTSFGHAMSEYKNDSQSKDEKDSNPCQLQDSVKKNEDGKDEKKPSITICTPKDGATVTSPVHLVAVVASWGRLSVQVLVDGKIVYTTSSDQIDTRLTLSEGVHSILVKSVATDDRNFSSSISVLVAGPHDVTAIKHIVYMLQENRSFDNYFGQLNDYRQMNGLPRDVDGLPAGASNLNYDGTALINSFHFLTACHFDLNPAWTPTHVDYNRFNPTSDIGLNDGFAYSAGQFARDQGLWDIQGQRAMGYYDWTNLPYYYFMATQFATSDRWFSPAPTRTGPNRYYAVSGTSAGHVYPANNLLTNPTIFNLLQNAGISWRVYLSTPGSTILNDFAGFTTTYADHFAPASQFATDAAAGKLAAVSLIEQDDQLDEHPGHNVQEGSAYVASLINALMNSRSWKDSVFILAWDEPGSMYDHVPSPPAISPDGIKPLDLTSTDVPGDFTRYGFRVPVIVVSPFTKANYVSHTVTDHTAILKLIETRFNLPSLTARDGNSADLMEFFDFVKVPNRLPPTPPAQPTNGACHYDRLP